MYEAPMADVNTGIDPVAASNNLDRWESDFDLD